MDFLYIAICLLIKGTLCVRIRPRINSSGVECFIDFGLWKTRLIPKSENPIPTPFCTTKLSQIPVFVVTFANCKPVLLNDPDGNTCWMSLYPQDAINLLTEISQLLPNGNQDVKLRICVTNLEKWLEGVDPSKPRIKNKINYKLLPNTLQTGIALDYIPATSQVEELIPLFYTNLTCGSTGNKPDDILLFFDYEDLISSINTLESELDRERAKNNIKVLSFIPLIRENPTLKGFKLVPSTTALGYCNAQRSPHTTQCHGETSWHHEEERFFPLVLLDCLQKSKTAPESDQLLTKYPLKYVGFDGIRDVDFIEDENILEDYGIPCPPKMLNIDINPDTHWDFYTIVKTVMEQYQSVLMEILSNGSSNASDSNNQRFDKRRGMLIKLVDAVGLKWKNAYRWKAYDRALVKGLDVESFASTRKTYQRTHQDLQIYQVLWQEHCQSMRLLLGEWNDVNEILQRYKLQALPACTPMGEEQDEQPCEMKTIIDSLNDMVQDCFNENLTTLMEPIGDLKNLSTLLEGLTLDEETSNCISNLESKLSELRLNKQKQLQTMVNVAIKNFERMLHTLCMQSASLTNFSRMLSYKLFKHTPNVEYIRLIQAWPQDNPTDPTIDGLVQK